MTKKDRQILTKFMHVVLSLLLLLVGVSLHVLGENESLDLADALRAKCDEILSESSSWSNEE